jgi:predicted CXXCH cytochrome family protein
MLNIINTSSAKKIMVVALFASSLLAAGNSFAAREHGQGSCSFSRQLEDPVEKSLFLVKVSAARKAATSVYGESYGDETRVIYNNGERFEIDSFSADCVSCHDGMGASAHDIRFKNAGRFDSATIGNPLDSHPIGMHYGDASYVNNQLKNVNSLNPNMLFVNGRVGCLSCHNPVNPRGNHLVVENEYSNLCFSCHIK